MNFVEQYIILILNTEGEWKMKEFLGTYWYFFVAGILLVAVIVYWVIEISKSKKPNKSLEEKLISGEEYINIDLDPAKEENNNKKTESNKELVQNENKQEKDETTERKTSKSSKTKYNVTFDKEKNDWVVKKAGSERATKRCRTKKEAMEVIENLASKKDISISVKKKDGKFQKLDNAKKK